MKIAKNQNFLIGLELYDNGEFHAHLCTFYYFLMLLDKRKNAKLLNKELNDMSDLVT